MSSSAVTPAGFLTGLNAGQSPRWSFALENIITGRFLCLVSNPTRPSSPDKAETGCQVVSPPPAAGGLRGGLFPPAPQPAVCLLMPYQVRALGEGLPALVTGVGALACVGPLVPDEVGALAEGLPAVPARVGLGSGVCPQVLRDG